MPARSTLSALACTLVLVTGGATGCSNHSGQKLSDPTTAAKPVAMTAARAKTLAAAGILKGADLPGYLEQPPTADDGVNADETALLKCLGVVAKEPLARGQSLTFTHDASGVEVSSHAEVSASQAQAKAELAGFAGAKGEPCIKQALTAALTQGGATVERIEVAKSAVSVAGADATFAYVVALQMSSAGQPVALTGYQLGALVGQVEISVLLTCSGTAPPTLAATSKLLAKAVSRVRAASH